MLRAPSLLATAVLLLPTLVAQLAPRWGHASVYLPSPPTLLIQGGRVDASEQFTYSSAPTSSDTLLLPLSSSFAASDPPFQVATPFLNGPNYAWHCVAPLFNDGGNWTLLTFGGEGGWAEASAKGNDSAWTATLDPARNTAVYTNQDAGWGNEPTRRIHHTCAAPPAGGLVYITGGQSADGSNNAFTDVVAFNPLTNTFEHRAPLPVPLYHHLSVLLPNGTLLVWGGVYTSRETGSPTLAPWNQIYSLDTTHTTATWQTITIPGNVPVGRRGATATLSPDGTTIFIFGGADASLNNALGDGWKLNVATLEWAQVITSDNGPGARFDHTAVDVGGGQVIVFGGFGDDGPLDPTVSIIDTNYVPAATPTTGNGGNGGTTGGGVGSDTFQPGSNSSPASGTSDSGSNSGTNSGSDAPIAGSGQDNAGSGTSTSNTSPLVPTFTPVPAPPASSSDPNTIIVDNSGSGGSSSGTGSTPNPANSAPLLGGAPASGSPRPWPGATTAGDQPTGTAGVTGGVLTTQGDSPTASPTGSGAASDKANSSIKTVPVVVGSLLGFLVIIVLIALFIFFRYRKRQRKRNNAYLEHDGMPYVERVLRGDIEEAIEDEKHHKSRAAIAALGVGVNRAVSKIRSISGSSVPDDYQRIPNDAPPEEGGGMRRKSTRRVGQGIFRIGRTPNALDADYDADVSNLPGVHVIRNPPSSPEGERNAERHRYDILAGEVDDRLSIGEVDDRLSIGEDEGPLHIYHELSPIIESSGTPSGTEGADRRRRIGMYANVNSSSSGEILARTKTFSYSSLAPSTGNRQVSPEATSPFDDPPSRLSPDPYDADMSHWSSLSRRGQASSPVMTSANPSSALLIADFGSSPSLNLMDLSAVAALSATAQDERSARRTTNLSGISGISALSGKSSAPSMGDVNSAEIGSATLVRQASAAGSLVRADSLGRSHASPMAQVTAAPVTASITSPTTSVMSPPPVSPPPVSRDLAGVSPATDPFSSPVAAVAAGAAAGGATVALASATGSPTPRRTRDSFSRLRRLSESLQGIKRTPSSSARSPNPTLLDIRDPRQPPPHFPLHEDDNDTKEELSAVLEGDIFGPTTNLQLSYPSSPSKSIVSVPGKSMASVQSMRDLVVVRREVSVSSNEAAIMSTTDTPDVTPPDSPRRAHNSLGLDHRSLESSSQEQSQEHQPLLKPPGSDTDLGEFGTSTAHSVTTFNTYNTAKTSNSVYAASSSNSKGSGQTSASAHSAVMIVLESERQRTPVPLVYSPARSVSVSPSRSPRKDESESPILPSEHAASLSTRLGKLADAQDMSNPFDDAQESDPFDTSDAGAEFGSSWATATGGSDPKSAAEPSGISSPSMTPTAPLRYTSPSKTAVPTTPSRTASITSALTSPFTRTPSSKLSASLTSAPTTPTAHHTPSKSASGTPSRFGLKPTSTSTSASPSEPKRKNIVRRPVREHVHSINARGGGVPSKFREAIGGESPGGPGASPMADHATGASASSSSLAGTSGSSSSASSSPAPRRSTTTMYTAPKERLTVANPDSRANPSP